MLYALMKVRFVLVLYKMEVLIQKKLARGDHNVIFKTRKDGSNVTKVGDHKKQL